MVPAYKVPSVARRKEVSCPRMVNGSWNVRPPSVVMTTASLVPPSTRRYTVFASAGSTAMIRGCVSGAVGMLCGVQVPAAPELVLCNSFASVPELESEVA